MTGVDKPAKTPPMMLIATMVFMQKTASKAGAYELILSSMHQEQSTIGASGWLTTAWISQGRVA